MNSFSEFWPFYVREHSQPLTRRLHFVGTTLVLLLVIAAAALRRPWLLLLTPVCGYSFAWASHFLVEKNRPATFKYPLYSLVADFVMYGKMLRGQMDEEVRRASAGSSGNKTSTARSAQHA